MNLHFTLRAAPFIDSAVFSIRADLSRYFGPDDRSPLTSPSSFGRTKSSFDYYVSRIRCAPHLAAFWRVLRGCICFQAAARRKRRRSVVTVMTARQWCMNSSRAPLEHTTSPTVISKGLPHTSIVTGGGAVRALRNLLRDVPNPTVRLFSRALPAVFNCRWQFPENVV